MTGLLRAEVRKAASTKLWWGLLIPVAVLSVLVNLFGGLFTGALSTVDQQQVPVLLGSLAYSLGLTSVFAAVYGMVATATEFRHRTISTTYLTAAGRGRVLLAKMAVSAAVGALYALVTVLVGVLGGLAGQGGTAFPPAGSLLAVAAVGVVVAALWSGLGAALGTVVANLVVVLVCALVYILLGELLVSALLNSSDVPAIARLSAYLPVSAGEVALYGIPAEVLAGPGDAPAVVALLAGVTAPPPWWGALLVLATWTAAVASTGWVIGARRDVT